MEKNLYAECKTAFNVLGDLDGFTEAEKLSMSNEEIRSHIRQNAERTKEKLINSSKQRDLQST